MKTILLINGPNLNLLGTRQPEIYGCETLEEIVQKLKIISMQHDFLLNDYQNNVEGNIVSFLNEAYIAKNTSGIIINPAAYSHTSIAIRDALEMFVNVPIYEVHLSNIFARESFRHHSFVSPIATGVISGLGSFGYIAALQKILEIK